MLNKFVLLFVAFSGINVSIGQITGIYFCRDIGSHGEASCLSLYKAGSYILTIEETIPEDIPCSTVISYGDYSYIGNQIVLHDTYNGCQLNIELCDSSLIVRKAFGFIVNKRFEKLFNDHNWSVSLPSSQLSSLETYKHSNLKSDKFPFSYGTYSYLMTGIRLKIDFYIENNYKKYKLWYNEIILSKGQWYKLGNMIGLYDPSVKHTFYFFVDSKYILNKFFPITIEGENNYWSKD